jgi:hypothetical protein
MLGPDERHIITDVKPAFVPERDDGVARADGTDDREKPATGEDLAPLHGAARVAVDMADGERRRPDGTFGDVATVIAHPFTGRQMVDADDAGPEAVGRPQLPALHRALGHVATV